MDFFNQTGHMAIGTRLRMLSDKVSDDAAQVYQLFDVDLQPKWFPVFHVLQQGEFTITEIAQQIGHSHPSVSKIVSEMAKKKIVTENKDKNDGRRNVIKLSENGRSMAEKFQKQVVDVGSAVQEILESSRNNLWEAIEEWEYLLEQKSLYRRIVEHKKLREAQDVSIVPFEEKYAKDFKALNEEWISTYFKMESADHQSLDHPKEYILDRGGEIFIALYQDEVVGSCALIKMNDPQYDYELAKMAVSPKVQGKNIGWLLGSTIVNRAKELGGRNLYLESNTMLKPAINLYQKLGFEKVVGRATPYERCNIQMELKFNL